ncbi:MAG: S26 family signal peptidase [Steroidobacteraceae bacterium]
MRARRNRPRAPEADRRLPAIRCVDAHRFATLTENEPLPSPDGGRFALHWPTGARRTVTLACAGVLACLGASWLHAPFSLLYNPSASVARGWYLIVPATRLKVGVLVIAHLPVWAARLAAARGYLPITVPVIKRIAARGDEHVCERAGILSIDGRPVARALTADSASRPLPAWRGCRDLRVNEFLLLGEGAADSYDSRYFGPVVASGIMGRAIPLWTWR